MPCYHPIPVKRTSEGMQLHPRTKDGYTTDPSYWVRCDKCLGCREIQQQQLAIRVKHEARNFENNAFLTLTYDEDNVPLGLAKRELVLFHKRLRRYAESKYKHLSCGEMGDRTKRPHYHSAVLGMPAFNDYKKWDAENDRSATLERIWGNGIVTVSQLTNDRINYVAGYVLKKAGYRKQVYVTEDGEWLEPPFRTMSKGMGLGWVWKYGADLRNGYLQHDEAKIAIPRYYMDEISKNETLRKQIQENRQKVDRELSGEDRERLRVAEKIREKQIRERRARDAI